MADCNTDPEGSLMLQRRSVLRVHLAMIIVLAATGAQADDCRKSVYDQRRLSRSEEKTEQHRRHPDGRPDDEARLLTRAPTQISVEGKGNNLKN